MNFRPGLPCAVLLLSACAGAPRTSPPPVAATPPPPVHATVGTAQEAFVPLASASGSLVSGRASLLAADGGVRVTGEVGGLVRNGAHGLQVHERGDCSAADAGSAGAYFDPAAGADQRGVVAGAGTLRIVADAEGVARFDLQVPGAVLGGGAANDIAGRALVVSGATPGSFSARVACGVIRVVR
ncbi:superoxide dismutase family protein [Luteimonas sp. MHLX1A]|uniref:superoxide dismutase family protein n=1 Tax=Alterluteimonas muca TaxID=2878684 RepID=UPI001E2947E9|nr:superoxide dismutase family protein [Luteimonas sp. MHLX1A]MCD9045205.1 superoxide dismutase family protein [Luteimonas sp. MHLX1A]